MMAFLLRHLQVVLMAVVVSVILFLSIESSSSLSTTNMSINYNSNNYDYSQSRVFDDIHDSGDSPQTTIHNNDDDVTNADHFQDRLLDGSIPAWRLGLVSFLCWIITSSAVAAGIGGGGLLVPLYTMGLGTGNSPKLAIPISAATILGVAMGNAAFLVTDQRHPRANRPLVDYATVVLMQPGELVGVVGGVLLNRILPDVILVVLLVLVLGVTAYKTLEKGYARWQAETKIISALPGVQGASVQPNGHQVLVVVEDASDDGAHNSGNEEEMTTSYTLSAEAASVTDNDRDQDPLEDEYDVDRSASLAKIEDDEARQFPATIYAALMAMTTFLLMYSLLVNGILVPGFNNCSPILYWLAYASPIVVFGTTLWYFATINMNRYRTKVELGFHFVDGDVHWTSQAVRLLIPAAVGAGLLAGMLGIGGGMVLGPLFVALNFEVSFLLPAVPHCASME